MGSITPGYTPQYSAPKFGMSRAIVNPETVHRLGTDILTSLRNGETVPLPSGKFLTHLRAPGDSNGLTGLLNVADKADATGILPAYRPTVGGADQVVASNPNGISLSLIGKDEVVATTGSHTPIAGTDARNLADYTRHANNPVLAGQEVQAPARLLDRTSPLDEGAYVTTDGTYVTPQGGGFAPIPNPAALGVQPKPHVLDINA